MAAERRPRVALLEPAGRGGIHHYARGLAAALAGAGVEVHLFTARDHEFAASDRAMPPPFALHGCFARLRTPPFALLRALRACRPDVVHLQAGTHPLLHLALLRAVRAATGAPVVVTAHDLQPKNSGRFGACCASLLHRAASRIVVHSEALRAALAARQPAVAARARVVPHGDYAFLAEDAATIATAATRARDGAPTLLFFGYLHEEKGLADLIEALPTIAARVPAVRLVVAGQPEMEVAPLQARAAALDVAERIEWRLGYVERASIAPLFERATAVVLPYRAATSQSGVLFLAGAYGKPLIATRVGALPEAITHGESGWLCAPSDPSALAEGAIALLSDPGRSQEMGKKHALRCRTEGAWTVIAERTRALYAEVAPAAAPRLPEKAGGEAPRESVVDARGTAVCR